MLDSTKEVIPAYKTNPAMTKDDMYSILPYPIGCFLSGAFLAIFSPIIVTIDDKASDTLLTASRIKAIELTKIPKIALNAANKTFVNIAIILVLTIIFPLSSASFVIS